MLSIITMTIIIFMLCGRKVRHPKVDGVYGPWIIIHNSTCHIDFSPQAYKILGASAPSVWQLYKMFHYPRS